ncbi:hypothetical protein [Fodinibius sp. Rm-B-1B1-1]|uniref:hypothetical protein n=1 Tax=Fodinibius alkaliphilus TaxID=3140241 RepID=UPI00315A65D9
MLIIVMGLLVALGYTFMGMTSQRKAMTKQSVNTAEQAMTQNMTRTGIEFGINELSENPSWEKNSKITKTIDGGTIEYFWSDIPSSNNIKLTVTATVNNTSNKIFATVSTGEAIDLSQIPGAMGVYGDGTQVQINGNPPQIDGRNYDMDASAPNGDQDSYKSGVTGINSEGETFNFSGNSNEVGGDYIEGSPRYNEDPELDGQVWNDEIANKYVPSAEPYNGDLGSRSSPKIITVSGNESYGSSAEGAGILIVEAGGSLQLTGDMSYYGLIIIKGNLKLSGSPQIYGSVIFADNSSIDVEEDPEGVYSGNPDIRYSSDALNNVNEKLQTSGSETKLVSMYN